jgi:uncharacterized membrane protein YbhN (UPF0104 family)
VAFTATARRLFTGWAARLTVSALVLAGIFSLFPLRDVLAAIGSIDTRLWLTSLAIFVVGHVVSAAKWGLVADSGAGFPAVLRAHFGGLVANLCLPGVAGGDVVRAALLYKRVSDTPRLALGSVVDRLIDTLGLLLVALVGLSLALGGSVSDGSVLVWTGSSVAVFVVATITLARFHPLLVRLLPEGRLRRLGEKVSAALGAQLRQPLRLCLCLALSIAVQIAFIGVNIDLARAAGIDVPVAAWFFAWPLSKIIATVPVSLAGIGVREASLAALLAPFGAEPAMVVAVGLVWQTILIAGGLIGALLLLASGRLLARRADISAGGS